MAETIRVGSSDDDRFDRSRRIEWLDLEAISKARVLMVGAGALGNEVGKDLALSGFKHITVVDMDHVVGSNLNRCLFFTKADAKGRTNKAEAIARGIRGLFDEAEPVAVTARIEDASPGLFAEHDVVLGCLDNVEARVHSNSHAYSSGKVYIDGGMQGFLGKVMLARPPNGACVQCGMNRSHARIAALRFSCTGRDLVFHEPRLAAEITTTSMISAIIVRESLKVVCGRTDLLLNNALYYDGLRNVCEEIEVPLNPGCPVHTRA